MNNKHYEAIYNEFADGHEYLLKNMDDWRPKGDWGIRVSLNDGSMYDYDAISKSVRKARDDRMLTKDDINEGQCRDSFAYHLAAMMNIRGYTQRTLSEYTGISVGAINAYLNKAKTPSLTNVRKIAYALDCSVAELID